MKLVFSSDCPYCRRAEAAISRLDVFGHVESVPIESDEGRELVEDHHDEYKHTPICSQTKSSTTGLRPRQKDS